MTVGRSDGRTVGLFGVLAYLSVSPTVQQSDVYAVLDRAATTYQTVSTLSADFTQIIVNPMIGAPDTTWGRLYEMRPSHFAMRFTRPKGDRVVADGRWLWLYTPSTTPGQVIRTKIPEVGTTGPNLIGQFVERPRERYRARYLRADSLPTGVADVLRLTPLARDWPYDDALIWVDRATALITRLDIGESSGQRRVLILRNVRVNDGVPQREVTFSRPAGVRVVDADSARD